MFDVCLINPPTSSPADLQPYFPMSLVTLGGAIKENNFSGIIVDFELLSRNSKWSERDFLLQVRSHLKDIPAKLYGITTVCSNYAAALLIADIIKEINPSTKVILGGPQASLVPLETLKAFPSVDMVVCGEGEITLIDIMKSNLGKEQLQGIDGLAFRINGQPVLTPKRKMIMNLDDLPYPDYSLIPLKKYYEKEFWDDEDMFPSFIEAGRGCPFQCTFCSTSLMWSRQYRMKSPKRILSEMKNLYDTYGIDRFCLTHDNFTTNPEFLEAFCTYFQKHNTNLKWKVSSRADCLNEKHLKAMALSGCRGIFFGVETASSRMQQIIKKKLNLDNFNSLLNSCIELGITTCVAFMIGFPEETIEDIEKTFASALEYRRVGAKIIVFNKVGVLAGTEIFNDQLSNIKMLESPGINCSIYPDIPEVWDLTKRYPNLFSYAYSIPNPHFSEDTISQLLNFYKIATQDYPNEIYELIHFFGYPPLSLWEKWYSWCMETYCAVPVTLNDMALTFQNFIQTFKTAIALTMSPLFLSADVYTPELEM